MPCDFTHGWHLEIRKEERTGQKQSRSCRGHSDDGPMEGQEMGEGERGEFKK